MFLNAENVRNRNYVKKCLGHFALYICKLYFTNVHMQPSRRRGDCVDYQRPPNDKHPARQKRTNNPRALAARPNGAQRRGGRARRPRQPKRSTTMPAERLPTLERGRRRRNQAGGDGAQRPNPPARRAAARRAPQRQTPRMDAGRQRGQEVAARPGGGGTRERGDRPNRETTARSVAHCPQR